MSRHDITTLVIPVAGAGTRLYPLTYMMPKEMIRLVDKPVFYYLLDEAYQAKIRHIVFVTHYEHKMLRNFLKTKKGKLLLSDFPELRVTCIETKHRQGDGQALYEARRVLKNSEPFAVSMGDLIAFPGKSILKELYGAFKKIAAPVISVAQVPRRDTIRYGVIDPMMHTGNYYKVRAIVEKPKPSHAPSTLIMTGKYILSTDIFPYLKMLIDKNKTGEEIRLSEALGMYAADKNLYAVQCKNDYYDTGNKLDLIKTEVIFALSHPEFGRPVRSMLKNILL